MQTRPRRGGPGQLCALAAVAGATAVAAARVCGGGVNGSSWQLPAWEVAGRDGSGGSRSACVAVVGVTAPCRVLYRSCGSPSGSGPALTDPHVGGWTKHIQFALNVGLL